MIRNKKDLKEYLKRDRERYGVKFSVVHPLIYSETYAVYNYLKTLRHLELYLNMPKNLYSRICYWFYWLKHRRLSLKMNITIAPNTLGKGCLIVHPGFRRIGPSSKIGENCTILPNVLLGKKHPGDCTISIGNDCYISTGVTILGPITIGNNVTIGAGAVVTSDIPDNAVVGGVPARIINLNKTNDISFS